MEEGVPIKTEYEVYAHISNENLFVSHEDMLVPHNIFLVLAHFLHPHGLAIYLGQEIIQGSPQVP